MDPYQTYVDSAVEVVDVTSVVEDSMDDVSLSVDSVDSLLVVDLRISMVSIERSHRKSRILRGCADLGSRDRRASA